MIRTTRSQIKEMKSAILKTNIFRNEKVWTFLIASLLDVPGNRSRLTQRLCGEALPADEHFEVWFEGQPIPPRKGRAGATEGNTRVDLAFGHITRRHSTQAGIAYQPQREGSWVCFIEAKCLADCSTDVSYDPVRNQLARVVENLLCFQGEGRFPEKLFFVLLTPRLFMNPYRTARLYGYKMDEYAVDVQSLLTDIRTCPIAVRNGKGYTYPNLEERVQSLRLSWVAYEDLLEPEFGSNLDIVRAPERVKGLPERVLSVITDWLPSER